MEKKFISKRLDKDKLEFIADKGKYLCILCAMGLSYNIVNKLIEKDYNFKFNISKNPKIEIYK